MKINKIHISLNQKFHSNVFHCLYFLCIRHVQYRSSSSNTQQNSILKIIFPSSTQQFGQQVIILNYLTTATYAKPKLFRGDQNCCHSMHFLQSEQIVGFAEQCCRSFQIGLAAALFSEGKPDALKSQSLLEAFVHTKLFFHCTSIHDGMLKECSLATIFWLPGSPASNRFSLFKILLVGALLRLRCRFFF